MDSETLAACREGLLPRRKAGRVAAHVAHCAQCAGLDAQLAELPALLARSPAPPMPSALTARIEAALAAEAAARSASSERAAAPAAAGSAAADTAGAPAAAARGHRKARAPGPSRSRLVLRAAAVAAAVVVLAGGGYGLIHLLAGSGFSASSTAAPALGRMHKALAPAPGSPEHAAAGSSGLSRQAGPLIVASRTNYQPGQLQAQVRTTLQRFGRKATLNGPTAPVLTPAPSAAFDGLSACVRRVVGSQRVELEDFARYEGRPAAIIVVPGASPNTLRVLVVGTHCSAAPRPIFSTLLPSGG